VLDLTVAENLLLDGIQHPPFSVRGRLDRAEIAEASTQLVEHFNIRASSIHAPTRTLSGGNQQKVVLARALRAGASILLAYQPTRGLDLGASEELLGRLREAAETGSAVLVISSNLDELIRIGDRILVLYRGRVTGEAQGWAASREMLAAWMTGAEAR
jgi:simple sugar transport system ATP-binding protein